MLKQLDLPVVFLLLNSGENCHHHLSKGVGSLLNLVPCLLERFLVLTLCVKYNLDQRRTYITCIHMKFLYPYKLKFKI